MKLFNPSLTQVRDSPRQDGYRAVGPFKSYLLQGTSSFFANDWACLGHIIKNRLRPPNDCFVYETLPNLGLWMAELTGIGQGWVQYGRSLESASVAQKMSWASKRVTTRPEDTTYCLLGLFDIHMPLLYGEGKEAFIRLQHEIIRSTEDESIFAWGCHRTTLKKYAWSSVRNILADSPSLFADSADIISIHNTSVQGPSITNKGLEIHLKLTEADALFFDFDPRFFHRVVVALLACRPVSSARGQLGLPLVPIRDGQKLDSNE